MVLIIAGLLSVLLAPEPAMAQQDQQITIKVTKELDEYGQLVTYDSTYSISWNAADDSFRMKVDPNYLNIQFDPFNLNLTNFIGGFFSSDPFELFVNPDSGLVDHQHSLAPFSVFPQYDPFADDDFFKSLDELFEQHQNLLDDLIEMQIHIQTDSTSDSDGIKDVQSSQGTIKL